MYYILILNNGLSYGDFSDHVGGIFKNFEKAVEVGCKESIVSNEWYSNNTFFAIEEWKLNKLKPEHAWTFRKLNNKWMQEIDL